MHARYASEVLEQVEYEPVIGLEVHIQLSTRSKMFCSCGADYQSAAPNTRVCPVCLALPGVLPVINRAAVESAMKIGLALNCEIAELTKFDRKNYPYPDLMKGYQISQYDAPLASDGWLDIPAGDGSGKRVRIGITRVHMEEDVARLTHVPGDDGRPGGYALMDVNRAGVPLMEVVSEPDIRSPAQAEAYILTLQSIIRYLGVGTASMEEGSFRCDANVSVRPKGCNELLERTEIKNMNRVRAVERALAYEARRQTGLHKAGKRVVQETRGWDDHRSITVAQRSKEEAHDYRYFPEPDLPPLQIDRAWVEELRRSLPELPIARQERFEEEYGLSTYDASLITASRALADYFEKTVEAGGLDGGTRLAFAKETANWLNGEMARLLNADAGPDDISNVKIAPGQLAVLVEMFHKRDLSNAAAKQVLDEMFATGRNPAEIVSEKGLARVSDEETLLHTIEQVVAGNEAAVNDYLGGKETAVKFLVGQVMKATRGRADASIAADLLKKTLDALNTPS